MSTTWDDARRQAKEMEDERYPEPEESEEDRCSTCGLKHLIPHCAELHHAVREEDL